MKLLDLRDNAASLVREGAAIARDSGGSPAPSCASGQAPARPARPVATAAHVATPPARLTLREAEVLGLIAAGKSNREMATILRRSERTIERHIESLYRKIDARNRADATAYAFRHQLA